MRTCGFLVYVGGDFPFILPLVAVLPFADSLAVDQSEGYLRYLVVRTNYRKYLAAKFLANALVTAAAHPFATDLPVPVCQYCCTAHRCCR